VTEFLFYQVQGEPPESVLPTLVERSRGRGWKVVVQVTTPERLQALDEHLWTYTDDSFLPHGTDLEPNAAEHPVLLTLGDANGNDAAIRFLVDGAALPADPSGYERVIVLFDGKEDEALTLARAQWRAVKASGHEATYWLRDEDGRWRKKA
jgi:DNA polymerase-3 subunit chi